MSYDEFCVLTGCFDNLASEKVKLIHILPQKKAKKINIFNIQHTCDGLLLSFYS